MCTNILELIGPSRICTVDQRPAQQSRTVDRVFRVFVRLAAAEYRPTTTSNQIGDCTRMCVYVSEILTCTYHGMTAIGLQ
jgi:hypothetical protein